MEIQKAKSILSEKNIKISNHRVYILSYLIENNNHPTANTIYDDLHKLLPSLSKATVYNTLEFFLKKGIIKKIIFDDNSTHYDAFLNFHAHFYCKICKQIFDININDIDNNIININSLKKLKFINNNLIQNISINFEGICKKCQIK